MAGLLNNEQLYLSINMAIAQWGGALLVSQGKDKRN
jgi:hypothetical protein